MSVFKKVFSGGTVEELTHEGRIIAAEKEYDDAVLTFVNAQEGLKTAIVELEETREAVYDEIKALQSLVEDTDRRINRNKKMKTKLDEFLE